MTAPPPINAPVKIPSCLECRSSVGQGGQDTPPSTTPHYSRQHTANQQYREDQRTLKQYRKDQRTLKSQCPVLVLGLARWRRRLAGHPRIPSLGHGQLLLHGLHCLWVAFETIPILSVAWMVVWLVFLVFTRTFGIGVC